MSSGAQGQSEDCRRIIRLLRTIGEKWTVVLLSTLGDERLRFGELHRALKGISQRMLTVTLRNLERDGLLLRTVYPTVPLRVEYELTDRGQSLRKALAPFSEWVLLNCEAIEESQRHFDRLTNTDSVLNLPISK